MERAYESFLESEVLLKDSKREYAAFKDYMTQEVVDLGTRDKTEAAYEAAQKRYEIAKKNYEIAVEGSRTEEIQAGKAFKGCGSGTGKTDREADRRRKQPSFPLMGSSANVMLSSGSMYP